MIELSKKIKSNPKFSRERTSPQQEAHFRAEDEATIRWWVDEIRQAKDLIVRRKLIATMVGQAKKGAISTTIVGQVIKRARIHDEVDAMRLRKMINPSNGKLNSKLYESFHGVAPTRKVKVYYEPPPNELIAIGELKQINYKPIRGPRRDVEYYHRGGDLGERKIETNIILATDKAGKNLYLVRKNKNSKYPIFTERGIIG